MLEHENSFNHLIKQWLYEYYLIGHKYGLLTMQQMEKAEAARMKLGGYTLSNHNTVKKAPRTAVTIRHNNSHTQVA